MATGEARREGGGVDPVRPIYHLLLRSPSSRGGDAEEGVKVMSVGRRILTGEAPR